MNKYNEPQVEGMLQAVYQMASKTMLQQIADDPMFAVRMLEAMAKNNGQYEWPRVRISQTFDTTAIDFVKNGEMLYSLKLENDEVDGGIKVPKIADSMAKFNEHIISHQNVKKALAVAARMHAIRVNSLDDEFCQVKIEKQNLLIKGQPGEGKSALANLVGEVINAPVTIEDSSSLTPEGFLGRGMTDVARKIYLNAGKNIALAERSVVVFDEFCKLGTHYSGPDVGKFKQGVLNEMLKFAEGGKVTFKMSAQDTEEITLDTSNILCIACGAFAGMEDFFQETGGMGFGAEFVGNKTPEASDIVGDIDVEHFVRYGLNRQVMRRFPNIAHLDTLNEGDYVHIQTKTANALPKQWDYIFSTLDQNVKLTLTPAVAKYVANNAIQQHIGASALIAEYNTLLEQAFITAEGDETITEVTVRINKGTPVVQYKYAEPEKKLKVTLSVAPKASKKTISSGSKAL